ncbi:LysE family translocator [Acuticoccus sp. M5D2P5]|uniref:LysE family translocator n=1 Tax=Acuticoccus kalidii TaxID=2910977 RepID=UPI001F329DBE|nr:LysE family translocator [Acuticoccus kalidii]MCF3932753.1 LysE family translocator [Acuticoccus kalidii]
MFDASVILTFFIASAAIVAVPGPTVSMIVANSLRTGPAAGLANVAGTQAGLATMILVVALGLDMVVAVMGEAFFVVKLAGAAYLVYLGIKLWRAGGVVARSKGTARSSLGYALQGFIVIWSNPKALLFFGAFIPQFVDRANGTALQVIVYGGIFMVVATLIDSLYALLAGKAGRLLTQGRVKLVERISGSLLVAGGVSLAFVRR